MIAVILISAGIGYFLSLPFASVLQGANYRINTYFSRAKKSLSICAVYALFASAYAVIISILCGAIMRMILTFCAYLSVAVFTFIMHKKMRVPMVFTNRLTRLLIANELLYLLLFTWLHFTDFRAVWAACPAISPFSLSLASVLVSPLEKKNNARYLAEAKEKLLKSEAIKIGITGSYGKTSAKTAIEAFLSLHYKTLVSPANYNTPLGVAKTMALADGGEEVLVLEMGARRKGDIRELCEMIRPTVGVLTGIAPQHLETFKTEHEILAEKGELARSVPPDGVVLFNLTDPKVRLLYEEREGRKIGVGFEGAEYLIRDLKMTADGSAFSLIREGKKMISLTIPIVGKAGVVNCALAVALALTLGLSEKEIDEGAKRLRSAEHRFEVVKRGEVTVIDDSYNINPIGARMALESLACFAGRRIVYCSGMVELGDQEVFLNRELGAEIAANASMAILAEGKFADYVAKGIKEKKKSFPIFRVKDTSEASSLFKSVLRKGDVLLIMSDLPRDYLI